MSNYFVHIKQFLFTNQSLRQTVAKNAFWMGINQLMGRLIRAVIVIYATRLLGAEGWGAFSYAVGLGAFLTIFSDIGITGLITREISKERNEELYSRYLSTGFFIKSFMLIIGIGIFIFGRNYFTDSPAVAALIPLVAILTAIDGLRDLLIGIARARQRIELETWANLIMNIATTLLGFAFLSIAPTGTMLIYAYLAGSTIGLTALFFTFRNYVRNFFSHFSWNLIKPIITHAWPLGITALMGAMMINTDLILIGIMRPIAEVGFFSAAQRPIQLVYILAGFLMVPLFPILSQFAERHNEFSKILQKGLYILTLAAIPLALTGLLLGKELVLFLYGEAYLATVPIFKILSLTILMTFPSGLIGNALFAMGRERPMTLYTVIGAGGNAILDILLIPTFGIIGCAWATVGTQFASNCYAWWHMRDKLSFDFAQSFYRPVIAGVVMTVIILILMQVHINFLITTAAGLVAYALAIVALKEPLIAEARRMFS